MDSDRIDIDSISDQIEDDSAEWQPVHKSTDHSDSISEPEQIEDEDDSAEWQPVHKSSHRIEFKKQGRYKPRTSKSAFVTKSSPRKPISTSSIPKGKDDDDEYYTVKPKRQPKPKPKRQLKKQDTRLPFNKYSIVKILENEEIEFDTKMNMVKDLLSLTTLIKMQYGKVTEWASKEFQLDPNYFKQLFDFRYGAHTISDKISKFKIPVYVPWIEYSSEEDKLIDHSIGTGMYRTYSNQFFNLNNNSISLSVLDKTWDIDLWLTVLSCIPSIQVYDLDTINTLSALYIELIRSYSITLHGDERKKFDIYKNIKEYISIIYKYMSRNGLITMDYSNYSSWPSNVKIAMDAITEGEIKFYFGSNLFYKINIHNLTYGSSEEAIKYIIDIIYYTNEKKTIAVNGIFELENSEIVNNKIIKLIYNILKMPKEVDVKLVTHGALAGQPIIFYHNKIHLLAAIFKYIIGFERKFEKPLSKINKFCLLWNVIKQYSVKKICDARIIDDEEMEIVENKLDDVDYIYNVIESTQENLLGLIQVIGFRLLTLLQNSTEISMNSRQITCMEEFINTKLNNINNIDILMQMPNKYKIWLNYIKDINNKEIPYKFNYTPIKLYREKCKEGIIAFEDLPKALTLNDGFKNISLRLIDMKTPDIMGFPFDV